MIAAAVAAHLKDKGLAPVRVAMLGDYRAGAGPVWAVYDEAGRDVPRLNTETEEVYEARLQIRARADDMRAAVDAVDRAFRIVRAIKGAELIDAASGKRYRVLRHAAINRPNWLPSPTPGEIATTNFDLWVREYPA